MITALDFFAGLKWIDGSPLQIQRYRQAIFQKSLDTYRYDGVPQYTLVLAGRGKKNEKSLDLILGGLYVLMCRSSPQGSDALIISNDKDQADQNLDLAKKLVRINGLDGDGGELVILADEIARISTPPVIRAATPQRWRRRDLSRSAAVARPHSGQPAQDS
jgi:hypothetical protein